MAFEQCFDLLNIDQPTSLFVGGASNLTPENSERELKLMRRKVESGVDFFLTQPIFDPQKAMTFLRVYEHLFGKLQVPRIAGILPLVSERHAGFLHHEVPGISIPDSIQSL